MTLTLGEMICKARGITPEAGTLKGVCACCGRPTELGHVFKDTGTFTTYQYFPGGDCLCPPCHHIRHERLYTRSMFACTPSVFREFKFNEAESVLCNPPAEPFVMYFTRTWKKPGYLNLVNRINYSRDQYIVGCDYDLITVNAAQRDEYLALIRDALAKGAYKSELSIGCFSAKSYRKLDDYGLVERLQELAYDPLYGLCVYICKNPNARPVVKGKQEKL